MDTLHSMSKNLVIYLVRNLKGEIYVSKIGRNQPCICGSGKKYKRCCYGNNEIKLEKNNIINFSMDYNTIKKDFLSKGINISEPGFYDDKVFLETEQDNPKYLNNYARFVDTRPYDSLYIDQARREIPFIAKLLNKLLIRDGKLGACIDVSMVLSKILEMEGYWNYIVKGALTLNFSNELSIERKHFWPIDFTDSNAAHVWISAPPFNIIDITLKQQPYIDGEERFLPDYIIEECKNIAKVDYRDIFSPEARKYINMKYGTKNRDLIRVHASDALEVINVFNPYLIKDKHVEVKYITVAISAPDAPLNKMKNLCLEGMYGYSIYKEVILPALKEFRSAHKTK